MTSNSLILLTLPLQFEILQNATTLSIKYQKLLNVLHNSSRVVQLISDGPFFTYIKFKYYFKSWTAICQICTTPSTNLTKHCFWVDVLAILNKIWTKFLTFQLRHDLFVYMYAMLVSHISYALYAYNYLAINHKFNYKYTLLK